MCGRYSLAVPPKKLGKQLQLEVPEEYQLRYNIAPTQKSWVVTAEGDQHVLQQMVWGLVPHWSKDGKPSGKLINARCEGIISRPSFRMPVRKHRCLVPADSFYEWQKEGKQKIPYRILPKQEDSIMVMAGIYDVWKHESGRKLYSFSIITCPPNEEAGQLHNRMPVIFSAPEIQKMWLQEPDHYKALELLQTAEDDSLYYYRISTDLNKPINDYAGLHEEVQGDQPTLF